jgi:hypothetical protein
LELHRAAQYLFVMIQKCGEAMAPAKTNFVIYSRLILSFFVQIID